MDGASLTFGQLFEEARSIAAHLAAHGVGHTDRVAVILPAGLDFIRVFFAAQLLGAATCAINPFSSPETVMQRAARARPKLIVSRMPGTLHAAPLPDVPRAESDIAFLQPTSGTSGEPRLAMVLQRNVLAYLRMNSVAMGLDGTDVFVSWAPPWHDLGLVRFILTPLYVGAPCHLVRPAIETIPQWLRTIESVRGTATGAPDFAYRLATRMVPPGAVDLSSLRDATDGGEPVRAATITTFEKQFGIDRVVRPGYGLAEATLGVSTARRRESIVVAPDGAVSCGHPLPGVEVRIDDDEILVRGETVFAGYFDAADATKAVLVDGWLHTGDLGRLGENGELYVLGRKRAMIKRAGSIIAPRELEEAALTVRGVKIAAATSIPSPESLIEQIVVAIELNGEDHPRAAAEVSAAVFRQLGFTPDRVEVLPSRAIPRTTNGKIRHEALRELLAGMNLSMAGPISPGDSRR